MSKFVTRTFERTEVTFEQLKEAADGKMAFVKQPIVTIDGVYKLGDADSEKTAMAAIGSPALARITGFKDVSLTLKLSTTAFIAAATAEMAANAAEKKEQN